MWQVQFFHRLRSIRAAAFQVFLKKEKNSKIQTTEDCVFKKFRPGNINDDIPARSAENPKSSGA